MLPRLRVFCCSDDVVVVIVPEIVPRLYIPQRIPAVRRHVAVPLGSHLVVPAPIETDIAVSIEDPTGVIGEDNDVGPSSPGNIQGWIVFADTHGTAGTFNAVAGSGAEAVKLGIERSKCLDLVAVIERSGCLHFVVAAQKNNKG